MGEGKSWLHDKTKEDSIQPTGPCVFAAREGLAG